LLCVAAIARTAEPPFERGFDLIHNELKLAQTGLRAMQIVSRPEDIDGATLACMRRSLGLETHICLLTRGEAGENATGSEHGNALAVLRTRETEACAEILGAKVWYLNLPDLGFRRTPEDALKGWGSQKALGQIARIIRLVRPHVVLVDDVPSGAEGQRRATVQLSNEAIAAAADAGKFAETMKEDGTQAWRVQKAYARCTFLGTGLAPGILVSTISLRDPLIGMSVAEIAALAMSKLASAGVPPADGGIRGLAPTVPRLPGEVQERSVLDRLKLEPAADVSEALKLLTTDDAKSGALAKVIARAAVGKQNVHLSRALVEAVGLKLNVRASESVTAVGESVSVTVAVANNGPLAIRVDGVQLIGESSQWEAAKTSAGKALAPGESAEFSGTIKAGEGACPNFPPEQTIFARLEERKPVRALVTVSVEGSTGTLSQDVPLDLAPARVAVIRPNPVLIFDDPDRPDNFPLPAVFRLVITNYQRAPEPLKLFAGIQPSNEAPVDRAVPFTFSEKGQTLAAEFRSAPPVALLNKGDIAVQTAIWTAERNFGGPVATLRRVPLKLPPNLTVALVRSRDDSIHSALKKLEDAGLGLTLLELTPEDLAVWDLNRLHTIVLDTGVLQQRPELLHSRDRLMQFMQDGGNVLCFGQKEMSKITPLPIELSEERVTDSSAPVKILRPQHLLLSSPCKIWERDFEGWVQERGHTFPQKWAPEYVALLSCGDNGEKPLDGGLLVADIGTGSFIYTSYSWDRQLRAGAPGAYRMLANMLSYSRMKRGVR
jgi:LmbE family N-acetylglucosaminyl deacetylase